MTKAPSNYNGSGVRELILDIQHESATTGPNFDDMQIYMDGPGVGDWSFDLYVSAHQDRADLGVNDYNTIAVDEQTGWRDPSVTYGPQLAGWQYPVESSGVLEIEVLAEFLWAPAFATDDVRQMMVGNDLVLNDAELGWEYFKDWTWLYRPGFGRSMSVLLSAFVDWERRGLEPGTIQFWPYFRGATQTEQAGLKQLSLKAYWEPFAFSGSSESGPLTKL